MTSQDNIKTLYDSAIKGLSTQYDNETFKSEEAFRSYVSDSKNAETIRQFLVDEGYDNETFATKEAFEKFIGLSSAPQSTTAGASGSNEVAPAGEAAQEAKVSPTIQRVEARAYYDHVTKGDLRLDPTINLDTLSQRQYYYYNPNKGKKLTPEEEAKQEEQLKGFYEWMKEHEFDPQFRNVYDSSEAYTRIDPNNPDKRTLNDYGSVDGYAPLLPDDYEAWRRSISQPGSFDQYIKLGKAMEDYYRKAWAEQNGQSASGMPEVVNNPTMQNAKSVPAVTQGLVDEKTLLGLTPEERMDYVHMITKAQGNHSVITHVYSRKEGTLSEDLYVVPLSNGSKAFITKAGKVVPVPLDTVSWQEDAQIRGERYKDDYNKWVEEHDGSWDSFLEWSNARGFIYEDEGEIFKDVYDDNGNKLSPEDGKARILGGRAQMLYDYLSTHTKVYEDTLKKLQEILPGIEDSIRAEESAELHRQTDDVFMDDPNTFNVYRNQVHAKYDPEAKAIEKAWDQMSPYIEKITGGKNSYAYAEAYSEFNKWAFDRNVRKEYKVGISQAILQAAAGGKDGDGVSKLEKMHPTINSIAAHVDYAVGGAIQDSFLGQLFTAGNNTAYEQSYKQYADMYDPRNNALTGGIRGFGAMFLDMPLYEATGKAVQLTFGALGDVGLAVARQAGWFDKGIKASLASRGIEATPEAISALRPVASRASQIRLSNAWGYKYVYTPLLSSVQQGSGFALADVGKGLIIDSLNGMEWSNGVDKAGYYSETGPDGKEYTVWKQPEGILANMKKNALHGYVFGGTMGLINPYFSYLAYGKGAYTKMFYNTLGFAAKPAAVTLTSMGVKFLPGEYEELKHAREMEIGEEKQKEKERLIEKYTDKAGIINWDAPELKNFDTSYTMTDEETNAYLWGTFWNDFIVNAGMIAGFEAMRPVRFMFSRKYDWTDENYAIDQEKARRGRELTPEELKAVRSQFRDENGNFRNTWNLSPSEVITNIRSNIADMQAQDAREKIMNWTSTERKKLAKNANTAELITAVEKITDLNKNLSDLIGKDGALTAEGRETFNNLVRGLYELRDGDVFTQNMLSKLLYRITGRMFAPSYVASTEVDLKKRDKKTGGQHVSEEDLAEVTSDSGLVIIDHVDANTDKASDEYDVTWCAQAWNERGELVDEAFFDTREEADKFAQQYKPQIESTIIARDVNAMLTAEIQLNWQSWLASLIAEHGNKSKADYTAVDKALETMLENAPETVEYKNAMDVVVRWMAENKCQSLNRAKQVVADKFGIPVAVLEEALIGRSMEEALDLDPQCIEMGKGLYRTRNDQAYVKEFMKELERRNQRGAEDKLIEQSRGMDEAENTRSEVIANEVKEALANGGGTTHVTGETVIRNKVAEEKLKALGVSPEEALKMSQDDSQSQEVRDACTEYLKTKEDLSAIDAQVEEAVNNAVQPEIAKLDVLENMSPDGSQPMDTIITAKLKSDPNKPIYITSGDPRVDGVVTAKYEDGTDVVTDEGNTGIPSTLIDGESLVISPKESVVENLKAQTRARMEAQIADIKSGRNNLAEFVDGKGRTVKNTGIVDPESGLNIVDIDGKQEKMSEADLMKLYEEGVRANIEKEIQAKNERMRIEEERKAKKEEYLKEHPEEPVPEGPQNDPNQPLDKLPKMSDGVRFDYDNMTPDQAFEYLEGTHIPEGERDRMTGRKKGTAAYNAKLELDNANVELDKLKGNDLGGDLEERVGGRREADRAYYEKAKAFWEKVLERAGREQMADPEFKGIADGVESYNFRKASPEWMSWMDAIAKALGLKVEFKDLGEEGNNGKNSGGVITINTHGTVTRVNEAGEEGQYIVNITPEGVVKTINEYMSAVTGHEITHTFFLEDRERMEAFTSMAKEYLGEEKWNAILLQKLDGYIPQHKVDGEGKIVEVSQARLKWDMIDSDPTMTLEQKMDAGFALVEQYRDTSTKVKGERRKLSGREYLEEEIACDMAGKLFTDASFIKRLADSAMEVEKARQEEINRMREEGKEVPEDASEGDVTPLGKKLQFLSDLWEKFLALIQKLRGTDEKITNETVANDLQRENIDREAGEVDKVKTEREQLLENMQNTYLEIFNGIINNAKVEHAKELEESSEKAEKVRDESNPDFRRAKNFAMDLVEVEIKIKKAQMRYDGQTDEQAEAQIRSLTKEKARLEAEIDNIVKRDNIDKDFLDNLLINENNVVSLFRLTNGEIIDQQKQTLPDVAPMSPDFPNVMIHTTINSRTKENLELRQRAKAGDADAARELLQKTMKPEKVLGLRQQFPNAMIAYVHAEEGSGLNTIPGEMATYMKAVGGFEIADGIVQVNKPAHTGASANDRLIRQSRFGGDIIKGQEYIIVDDQFTAGGTLRCLRDYIESQGGKVVYATTLTCSQRGTQFVQKPETRKALYALGVTDAHVKALGLATSIDNLTEGEAKRLIQIAKVGPFSNAMGSSQLKSIGRDYESRQANNPRASLRRNGRGDSGSPEGGLLAEREGGQGSPERSKGADSRGREILEAVLPAAPDPINVRNAEADMLSDIANERFSLRSLPAPKVRKYGYKAFKIKNGKLYPPMVKNPEGKETPLGLFLDADIGTFAGKGKEGRAEVKSSGSGTLSFRPGWHLGYMPFGKQFLKKGKNLGKAQGNIVYALVEFDATNDYSAECDAYGVNANGKYVHSLGGVPYMPENGYYEYRTNPDPSTDAWAISGACRVLSVLSRAEEAEILGRSGVRAPEVFKDKLTDADVARLNAEIAKNLKGSMTGEEYVRMIDSIEKAKKMTFEEMHEYTYEDENGYSGAKKFPELSELEAVRSDEDALRAFRYSMIIKKGGANLDALRQQVNDYKRALAEKETASVKNKLGKAHQAWFNTLFNPKSENMRLVDAEGNMVAEKLDDGRIRFSERTFRGKDPNVPATRDVVVEWAKAHGGWDIVEKMDQLLDISDRMLNAKDENGEPLYRTYAKWANTSVVLDADGNPAFTIIKKNGEYPLNIDASTNCKKREETNAVLNDLISEGLIGKNGLSKSDIVALKKIITKHGLEIACDICFVDERRYASENQGKVTAKAHNYIVENYLLAGTGLKMEDLPHFNFGNDQTISNVEGFDYERLNWKNLEKVRDRYKPTTRLGVVVQNLLENHSLAKNMDWADFVGTEGRIGEQTSGADGKYAEALFNKVGASIMKRSDPQAHNLHQILTDNATVSGSDMTLYPKKIGHDENGNMYWEMPGEGKVLFGDSPEAVHDVYLIGGVRLQSFSDAQAWYWFDDAETILDLALKGLGAHKYTKELWNVKAFGKTGLKQNMSAVARLLPEGTVYKEDNRFGKAGEPVAAGLDEYGRPLWADHQIFDGDVIVASIQSIDVEASKKLHLTEGYSADNGVIAVGTSDEQIISLQEDNGISMIIGFHTNLKGEGAKIAGLDGSKNYVSCQHERYYTSPEEREAWLRGEVHSTDDAVGKNVESRSKALKGFNLYESLERYYKMAQEGKITMKDVVDMATNEYLHTCWDNNVIPEFDQYAWLRKDSWHGIDNFRGELLIGPDGYPIMRAGYYKHITDYCIVDGITGEYAPQKPVRMEFPTEADAFGSFESIITDAVRYFDDIDLKRAENHEGIKSEYRAYVDERNAQIRKNATDALQKLRKNPKARLTQEEAAAVERFFDAVSNNEITELWRHIRSGANKIQPRHINEAKMYGLEGRESLRVTPEMDTDYMNSAKVGDLVKTKKMVEEAVKKAMPETKVVDEAGKPLVVYHRTNATEIVNRETGEKYDDLSWEDREYWDEEATQEEWDNTWVEQDFNVFDNSYARRSVEVPGFFFAPEEFEDEGFGKRRVAAYINMKNPIVDPDLRAMGFDRGTTDDVMEKAMNHLIEQGYDGIINTEDGKPYEYIAFRPEQIKSADPITYDNNGEIIPLSERFNEVNPDIRYSERIVSPQFKKWFGDWEKDPENASKVVDEEGKPMIVHHGTRLYGFTVFYTQNEGLVNSNVGSHFGGMDAAETFVDEDPNSKTKGQNKGIYNVFLNIKKPYETYDWFAQDDFYPLTEAFELANQAGSAKAKEIINNIAKGIPENKWLQEAVRLYNEGTKINDIFDETTDFLGDGEGYSDLYLDNEAEQNVLYSGIRDLLKLNGYDGIKYWNDLEGEGYCWVALDPRQIKSADTEGEMANNGEFDPTNPDIRYSQRLGDTIDEAISRGVIVDPKDLMDEYGLEKLTLMNDGKYLELSMIRVKNKHQGDGTRFMTDLVNYADENNIPLSLSPSDRMGATSVSRLVKFYRRFGFKPNKGRYKDYSTRQAMIRQPQGVRYSERISQSDPFYSNAAKAVEGIKQEKATGEQWSAMLKKNGGLKAEEDKWMGLSEWLKGKKGVTKDDVMQFIAENSIKVEEVEYGGSVSNEDHLIYKDHILTENLIEDGTIGSDEVVYCTDNDDFAAAYFTKHPDGTCDVYIYDEKTASGLTQEKAEREVFAFYGQAHPSDVGEKIDYLNPVHPTRLGYTTEDLENKKEIALTVPSIEGYFGKMPEVHFADEHTEGKTVAWLRFGDAADVDGSKVLVIDEIQSQRHQDGKKVGYKSNSVDWENAKKEFKTFCDDMVEKYGTTRQKNEYKEDGTMRGSILKKMTPEEKSQFEALNNKVGETAKGLSLVGVPDAPFRKNWQELAMKRALRYAAEHGYDKIAWTTGEQQADRYNLARTVNGFDIVRAKDEAGEREIDVFMTDGRVDNILVNDKGIVIDGTGTFKYHLNHHVSEYFGKEWGQRLMTAEEGSINVADEKLGGTGMKAFYDKMLPDFMNKYGKKWGVKVGEVELDLPNEADRIMHSVDVTPEMKESVMQGQPLFSLRQVRDRKLQKEQLENLEALERLRDTMNDGGTITDLGRIWEPIAKRALEANSIWGETFGTIPSWKQKNIVSNAIVKAIDAIHTRTYEDDKTGERRVINAPSFRDVSEDGFWQDMYEERYSKRAPKTPLTPEEQAKVDGWKAQLAEARELDSKEIPEVLKRIREADAKGIQTYDENRTTLPEYAMPRHYWDTVNELKPILKSEGFKFTAKGIEKIQPKNQERLSARDFDETKVTPRKDEVKTSKWGIVKFGNLYKGLTGSDQIHYCKVWFTPSDDVRVTLDTVLSPVVFAHIPKDCFKMDGDDILSVDMTKADEYIRPYVIDGVKAAIDKYGNKDTRLSARIGNKLVDDSLDRVEELYTSKQVRIGDEELLKEYEGVVSPELLEQIRKDANDERIFAAYYKDLNEIIVFPKHMASLSPEEQKREMDSNNTHENVHALLHTKVDGKPLMTPADFNRVGKMLEKSIPVLADKMRALYGDDGLTEAQMREELVCEFLGYASGLGELRELAEGRWSLGNTVLDTEIQNIIKLLGYGKKNFGGDPDNAGRALREESTSYTGTQTADGLEDNGGNSSEGRTALAGESLLGELSERGKQKIEDYKRNSQSWSQSVIETELARIKRELQLYGRSLTRGRNAYTARGLRENINILVAEQKIAEDILRNKFGVSDRYSERLTGTSERERARQTLVNRSYYPIVARVKQLTNDASWAMYKLVDADGKVTEDSIVEALTFKNYKTEEEARAIAQEAMTLMGPEPTEEQISQEVQRINDRIIGRQQVADAETARKQVMTEIRKMLDDKRVDAITKSDLNRLLSQVSNARPDNLIETIEKAKRVSRELQTRVLGKELNNLLALKTQDRNGKNMSIAKNVGNQARLILDQIRNRMYGLTITDADQTISQLRSSNYRLREENRRMQFLMDRGDFGAEGTDSHNEALQGILDREAQIADNSQQIKGLEAERDKTIAKQITQGLGDIDKQLEDKRNYLADCVDPNNDAEWTEQDTAELTGLEIIKARAEVEQLDQDIRKAKADRAKATKAAQRRAFDTLIEDLERRRLKGVEDVVQMVRDVVEGGKASLAYQRAKEIEHRMEMVRSMMKDIDGGKGKKLGRGESSDRAKESWLKKLATAPLGSFEYMAHRIDVNHMSRDGWFYKYFVEGKNGVMASQSNYLTAMRKSMGSLQSKTEEIFGKKIDKVAQNMAEEVSPEEHKVTIALEQLDDAGNIVGVSRIPFSDWNTGTPSTLSKAQATYLHMVWKMEDGRAKLECMGFDEQTMAEIDEFIGQENIRWADWIQSEYLPEIFKRYNGRYMEIYGTSMKENENYVPLKIDPRAIGEEVDLSGDKRTESGMQIKNGSMINRTVNLKPVDTTINAFTVIADHVNEAEEFIAFASVRKDLEAVLGSKAVRDQLNANVAGQFQALQDAAMIAVHAAKSQANKGVDDAWGKVAKGLIGANIAFRNTTALKQILSVPAFLGYSQDPRFIGAFLKNATGQYLGNFFQIASNMALFGFPAKAIMSRIDQGKVHTGLTSTLNWCLENVPSFRERLLKGNMGIEVLEQDLGDSKFAKFIDAYLNQGMSSNKMVDAVTCAIGIKTIYDYRMAREMERINKQGLQGEEYQMAVDDAKSKALMEADIYYNGTQQSNHATFMSPMQLDRSMVNRMFSVYQNASIGYARKAAENWQNICKVANLKRLIRNYEAMYVDQGMTPEEARKKASSDVWRRARKSAVGLALYGMGLNLLWDMGSRGLIGLFQDDEEKDWYKDWTNWISYPMRGMPLFNAGKSAVDTAVATIDGGFGGRDYNPMLLFSEFSDAMKDVGRTTKDFGFWSPMVADKIISRSMKIMGVNPEVWANTYLALEDMIGRGLIKGEDIDLMTDLMLYLQTPNSLRPKVAKQLYGLDPKEYEKMTDQERQEAYEKYMKHVMYAMKAVGTDDWHMYIPGTKVLNTDKKKALMKELIKEVVPEEIQLKVAKENPDIADELKSISEISELETRFNAERDPKKKAQIGKDLKKRLSDNEYNPDDEAKTLLDKYFNPKKPKDTQKVSEAYTSRITAKDMKNDIRIQNVMTNLKEIYDELKMLEDTDETGEEYDEFLDTNYDDIELYEDLLEIRKEINEYKKELIEEGVDKTETMKEIRDLVKEALDLIDKKNK